jgi:hypothetical protein
MAKAKKKGKKKPTAKPWNMTKAQLSRSRGHMPVTLLKKYLAAMPRHQLEMAQLIKSRQEAGE